MARPVKKGLEYFPFDVDFFSDEKIEAISGEFGIKGEIITIRLLCAIYRNGYFIVWSEMLKMKLLKNLNGVSKELLEQIVLRLVKWNFFNENLFNSEKVLTSTGIQKRYSEAVKRRRNKDFTHHWLLNGVNVDINRQEKGVNVDINAQSKVKESKVEEDVTRKSTSPLDSDSIFSVEELKKSLLSNSDISSAIISCKDNKILDFKHLETRLNDFQEELKGSGTLVKQGNDFCKHFRSWHKKNAQNQTNQSVNEVNRFHKNIKLV